MAYTFTTAEVATAAKLNQIIGGTTLSGIAKVTPVANTPTSVHVKFSKPFTAAPAVVVTPQSVVSGTSIVEVSVTGRAVDGFDLVVYRTNTTNTYVAWQAWLDPAQFTTAEPAYANLLNQGGSGQIAQVGSVSITPSGSSVPTSSTVTFPTAFDSLPTVVTCAVTTVPGSLVLGTAATEVDEVGCKVWLTRASTTATTVAWIALGRM